MQIVDAAWQRSIQIQTTGSHSTVVWNPWIEIAAQMADLNDDDYQRFICVETANVADNTIKIAAQDQHRMGVEYTIEPQP